MEAVKELVFNLSFISLAVGVFRMLAPSGSLQKTAVMVMGLFTLVCFLAPFTANFHFDSLFSFSLEELTPSQTILEEHQVDLEQAAVDEITQTILALANQENISVKITGMKLQKDKGLFLVENLALVVEGTQHQAKNFTKRVEEVMKCEVSVAWTVE